MSKKLDASQVTNLDANESAFFARQLEYVKAKTYDVMYPELKARKILPVSFEAGPGAKTITYRQYDQVGVAKIIVSYAKDLPRADVKAKEFVGQVRSLGMSYGWDIMEIRHAAFAGVPLEQRRANAAKRGILQQENTIAMLGDATSGLNGFLNNANMTQVTLPADGTGATTTFSTKTADLIVRDLNSIANKPIAVSKGVESPDTLLLPITQYTYIASTPRSTTSDTTILNFFLQNNPFVKSVDWLNELAAAGAGATDRAIAYRRDPDKLTLEVPQDFEQFPVQQRGLEYIVPCHSRCGGVLIYYPLSIAYADGI